MKRAHAGVALCAAALTGAALADPSLDELEKMKDETIQSACHGYLLHQLAERVAAWFGSESPLCPRVQAGESPQRVIADLRRSGVRPPARTGTAEFRTSPDRIFIECDRDETCTTLRRDAERKGHPLDMATFEQVRTHCRRISPEGFTGCIRHALADWPELRLARSPQLMPLSGAFVTTVPARLLEAPAAGAALVGQLETGRPLLAEARSQDGAWLRVRDELSGARGFIATHEVRRSDGQTAGVAAAPESPPPTLDIDTLARSGQVSQQHQLNERMRAEQARQAQEAEARRRAEQERLEREAREQALAARRAEQARRDNEAARRDAQRRQNINALVTGIETMTQDMVAMRQQQHQGRIEGQREWERLSGESPGSGAGFGSGTGGSGASPSVASSPQLSPAEMCNRLGGRWTGSDCRAGTVPPAAAAASAPAGDESIALSSDLMAAMAARRSEITLRPNIFDARGKTGYRNCERYSDMQLITTCFHAQQAFLEYERSAMIGADPAHIDRAYEAHRISAENLIQLVDR